MRALRAINNLLAKAAISLAMFIVFLMVAALALSATTRFITGTGFAWFINGLNKSGIKIDRKILAEIAYDSPEAFKTIVQKAQSALN